MGIKCCILPTIKMNARTVVGSGAEGPLCKPRSELLLGGRARVVRVQYNKRDEETNKNKNKIDL